MIQISQLALPVTHTREDLEKKILKTLRIKKEQLLDFGIEKQSIDARKKRDIRFVYTIEAKTTDDQRLIRRLHQDTIRLLQKDIYRFPEPGTETLKQRPVIVGSGPAGLFCAYMLASYGYAPIILERGKTVGQRTKDVKQFWKSGILQPDSNVQFGEGGAGTFSDGKLNTLVKDDKGRNRKVLEIFTEHGAQKEICYEAKPHIGTDVLVNVVASIRRAIESRGGTFLFENRLSDIKICGGKLCAVELNRAEWMETETLVLAIGHSARDTFEMLCEKKIPMEAKSFAVGLRVEHLQEKISKNQYGEAFRILPPASYKVTAKGPSGRGVYSFCMCPGGYVVNASSEKKRLAVNGMSYRKRDSANANSAIIVSVTPQDFPGEGPLSAIAFQRKLEETAYRLADGAIPQQLFGDFRRKNEASSLYAFASMTCGAAQAAPLHRLFSADIYESFLAGMAQFDRKIPGFADDFTILSGVESRTSSPVRIHRNADFQSAVKGIYPCGEGAGYAGGIMSAAMDGIKTAEAIARRYKPLQK